MTFWTTQWVVDAIAAAKALDDAGLVIRVSSSVARLAVRGYSCLAQGDGTGQSEMIGLVLEFGSGAIPQAVSYTWNNRFPVSRSDRRAWLFDNYSLLGLHPSKFLGPIEGETDTLWLGTLDSAGRTDNLVGLSSLEVVKDLLEGK